MEKRNGHVSMQPVLVRLGGKEDRGDAPLSPDFFSGTYSVPTFPGLDSDHDQVGLDLFDHFQGLIT